MSLFQGDSLTQIAFSVYENKGVFAVLLGSGMSRAAEIPTGWEITLELVRRVALAQGVKEQPDWAIWYRGKTGKEPDYSALLEELAASPEERRSILHNYIEPNEEDREEGRKIPTKAHQAIADLVHSGYIRVIITTNFDRLMENALRERGIEPTVVASVDALAGAEPLTHTACYVLKLHGDYKDARILNTEAELSSYPAAYDTILDRILDEHGLIVCGWSGEWDHALRAAFLRAPNRRYSVYWAARGALGGGAEVLVKHRDARCIQIENADGFFSELKQRVETLEQSQRQNPLSIDLQISSAKRFLAKPEHRIQLDELFAEETERVLVQLDHAEFSPDEEWGREQVRARVRRYEALTETLASMAGVLGRWGDDGEHALVVDIIRSLCAHAYKKGSGNPRYLGLRSYPAVLIMTTYGLGLTRAERWAAVHRLFTASIDRPFGEPVPVTETLFLSAWKGGDDDIWRKLEGLEQLRTPLSDHLLALASEWRKRFIGLTPDFELLFERFEFLGSLADFGRNEKAHVQDDLADHSRIGLTWMPVGRVGWHIANAEKLVAEIQALPMKTALLQAGFGKGDPEFIDLFIENLNRAAATMRQ